MANSYNDTTLPTRTNQRYQWLEEHFAGIKPYGLMRGNELFKVKTEEGKQYMYLTRYVDWQFLNLNALFNTHVGSIKQTVILYCDIVDHRRGTETFFVEKSGTGASGWGTSYGRTPPSRMDSTA